MVVDVRESFHSGAVGIEEYVEDKRQAVEEVVRGW